MNDSIDIVVTWVDGGDQEWQKEKAKYQGGGVPVGDNRASRYRDWGFLRYWFRAIEQNASWVRRIHFVTWGHVPSWLNVDNKKLRIVKHEEFIPSKYLPTFSCRPIEFNLHRIPGLTERFVYFNDDMFLLRPSTKEDFFVDGLPCDIGVLDATIVNGRTADGTPIKTKDLYTSLIYNLMVVNRNFDKNTSISKNIRKWYNPRYGTKVLKTLLLSPWKKFTGFHTEHIPYSLMKSTYEELWDREFEILDNTCSHRFRANDDVSSRLLSFWQLAKGDFYPRSPSVGAMRAISSIEANNRQICKDIENRKWQLLCINDDYHGNEFDNTKELYIKAFEHVYPVRSSFEC